MHTQENKNLHTSVHSITHNNEKVEAAQTPSEGEWIDKMWYIQTADY